MSIMEERINTWELAFWGTGSIIVSIVLFYLFTYNSNLTNVEAVGSIAGAILIFTLTGFRSDIWNRPKSIEVLDDGIVLRLHFGRSTKLRWNDIGEITIHTDPYMKRKWDNCDAVMETKPDVKHRSNWYVLYWPNALAIRERYKEVIGRYPPNLFDKLSG